MYQIKQAFFISYNFFGGFIGLSYIGTRKWWNPNNNFWKKYRESKGQYNSKDLWCRVYQCRSRKTFFCV